MRYIVIVSSRHRGWQDGTPAREQRGSPQDRSMMEEMLRTFRQRYPSGFCVLAMGCDCGFGRMVKEVCDESGVGMMEVLVQFNRHLPRAQYELLHLSRHAALVDMGQEFHLFVTRKRISHIEDLVVRLRRSPLPYFVYDEANALVESQCPDAT